MGGWKNLDERISAFLDGEMSEKEMLAFEDEMASDDELAASVTAFGDADSLLQQAFDEPIQRGVDDALLARMGLSEMTEANRLMAKRDAAQTSGSTPAPANDNPPFWRKWAFPAGGAIAAGLAVMLYFGGGAGTGYDAEFNRALDETPSLEVAALPDGTSLSPLLSFRAGDGRYCREFTESRDGQGRTALACRGNDGWQVEASQKGAVRLADNGSITPASGADSSSLDEAYERLNAGDPIAAQEEAKLIGADWK